MGGALLPPEENADLPEFPPERAHLLLREVYGDFPHHNAGYHHDGGVADNTIWQRRWRRLAAKLARWHAMPIGAVGCRFTAILAVEWQGVNDRSWNSKKPLVFAHVVLTKTLGVRRDREIQVRITRRIDLWDRGLHAGLVGDTEAEGASREGRASSGGEEEEEAVSWSKHDMVFSGKLRQAIRRQPTWRGGGVSSWMTNAQKPGDQLQRVSGRSIRTCVPPPWKIPRAQTLRIMGRCRKRYPLTSRMMMLRG